MGNMDCSFFIELAMGKRSNLVLFYIGQVEEEQEVSLILKSQSHLSEQLIAMVKENHPAEVPCVLILPVQTGNPDFLSWLQEQTLATDKTSTCT